MTIPDVRPLVMFVDDEAASRVVFKRTFESLFRLAVYESAEAALVAIGTEEPAVLIVDQRMPGMQGTDALAIVREKHPDTVRIILSAFSDPQPLLEAINRAGAERYLIKPWNRQELTSLISSSLNAYSLKLRIRALEKEMVEAQRFAALGLATATVAHDMMGPVTVIATSLERLGEVERICSTSFEELKSLRSPSVLKPSESDLLSDMPPLLEELNDATGYLAALGHGIRNQAHAEAGASGDVVAAAHLAGMLVRGAVRYTHATLTLPKKVARPVTLSGPRLTQVFVNLLGNALYSLRGAKDPRLVSVEVSDEDDGVGVVVRDSGCGIEPSTLERLKTERFSTKPRGEGTGLGVAICRQLVTTAGGRFEMSSIVGEGTTVTMWLPVAVDPPADGSSTPQSA